MIRIDIATEDNVKNNPLMEIYVLDFEDNYHRIYDEPTSELEQAVRKIKRRYRDVNDYNEALLVYNDWMGLLAYKHGGKDIFKKKLKAELIEDYVPPKPRLRNNKTLHFLFDNGIVVSKKSKHLIDEDALDEYLDRQGFDYREAEFEFVKKDRDADKLIVDHIDTITRHKSISKKSDIDFLDEYFRMKNTSKKKSKKNKKKKSYHSTISLADLVSGEYLEEIEDTTDDDRPVMYEGRFLSASTAKELETYHKLNDLGWNSYKLMKNSNVGRSVTKIFKKKSKKSKKKKKMDKLLIDIMTDGGYDDFSDFAKDMEDFSAPNIFR